MKSGIMAVLLAGATLAVPASAQSFTDPASLHDRIAAIARTDAGRVGVAATIVETGAAVSFAGGNPFPMASTVKVAIAATYLANVDRGQASLDQTFRWGRRSISARTLIDAMLIRSDNGAADQLLRAVGGPGAVNAWLEKAGINGQRMDRTIASLIRDDRGPLRRRPVAALTPSAAAPQDGEVAPAFIGDARDTSTPKAMLSLLTKLHQGALLGADSTRYLFEVMERCVTGRSRIKGLLPAGTPVAHKTGTLYGVSDDVGVVTLPNGLHLALAIFASGMRSDGERNRSIAAITRVLYDNFGATGGFMALAAAR